MHAEADVVVLARPVGAQPLVARRPALGVVGRLEDADALHDRPVALRVARMREDRRYAEMAGRLILRVVPDVARRLALERAEQLPRLRAVTALEHTRRLCTGEETSVRGRETGDLRELRAAVGAVVQAFARMRPRLTEVAAPPDGRAVPLARRRCVDRAALRLEDGVVDRPAFAVRAAHVPVATVRTLGDEESLAGSDQQHRLFHQAASGAGGAGSGSGSLR